ncbi:pyridoxal-phosphate dependent enzyme [Brevibacterium litoralis]|uniref:pyridoxal-phosphate dependent enzyme n=1 Tax=Brevibacterium litoralis TaxID=3138935 RepID=UPI0032ED6E14
MSTRDVSASAAQGGTQVRTGAGGDGDRPFVVNDRDRDWRIDVPVGPAREFHRSMPGYAPTPLHRVPALADRWGVARVLIKDESDRLGLPAFKILGASWATAHVLAAHAGTPVPSTFEALRDLAATLRGEGASTLVTATDGNHGRALARMAHLLGLRSRVYLAGDLPVGVAEAIAGEGAEVIDTGAVYDEAVRAAADSCTSDTDLLVQDMSWEGYREPPARIVEGYSTLFAECEDQMVRVPFVADGGSALGGRDLVVVPAGVGCLLQAGLQHLRAAERAGLPRVLAVEPVAAACVTASVATGESVTVVTDVPTAMAGLNCGTVAGDALPVILAGLDAGVGVTDAEAAAAAATLRAAGVPAGPCGAATAAGVEAVLARPDGREVLGLGPDSTVVLVSTEAPW